MNKNISMTMKKIYGTGNFNPRSFERRPKRPGYRLYLWGMVFFIFAIIGVVAAGLYIFASPSDSFIGDKISFEIEGNKNPNAASNEKFILKIRNNEEVVLQDLELFIDWNSALSGNSSSAAHFISSEISPTSEANNTWDLGNLGSGQAKDFAFNARFVGPAGSEVEIPFSLTLRPEGFGSTFSVNHKETFSLGDPTIALSIDSPQTAQSKSKIILSILISGNSLAFGNVSELIARINFPESFSISKKVPEVKQGDPENEWILASLPREGDSYKISIEGSLEGSSGSKHKFSAFLARKGEDSALVSEEKEIMIQSPDASVSVSASPAQGKKLQWGEKVDYVVEIKNTSDFVMRNITASIGLGDDALWKADSLSIQNGGFFEGGNVLWDESGNDQLASLRPGSPVALKFSFVTAEKLPSNFSSRPTLSIKAIVNAKIQDQDLAIESQDVKTNILADLDFNLSARYKGPDEVEIIFKLGPTTSDLKDLEFSAPLGSGFEWKNESAYSIGELSFDSAANKAVWRASKVPAITDSIEVRFVAGISPNANSSTIVVDNSVLKVVDALADEAMEFFGNRISVSNIQ